MNMRERMLAVVQGREHDKVPFVQYEMGAMPDAQEAWSLIGKDNLGFLRWTSVFRTEAPSCRFEYEDIHHDGLDGMRTTLYTPAGVLTEEKLKDPALGSMATRKHFIQEPDDYKILIAHLRDVVVIEDLSDFHRAEADLSDYGLPHTSIMRTPYQNMWIQNVSLEKLCVHMMDYPELVEECMSLIGSILRKGFEVIRKAPVPYVVFPDNITAPTIGESYFRKYCLPYYKELSDMLAERNIPVYVHADGDLKPLWKAFGESGILGLDSFSPPPDNDTSVEEAATVWPKMRLGVNFPSSIHLASPKVIYDKAVQILEEAGHTGRLQIQISENVPPGTWRKSYPEIVRAINEFGKP